MRAYVPKKSPHLANSAINSDFSLAVYRTYKSILKDNLYPSMFVFEAGVRYKKNEHQTAYITFSVLRDMGAKYVHCDPWGSD